MIARLQQLTTLSWLASLWVWLGICFAAGWPAWGWIVLLVLALGHAAVLGLEFVLLRRVARQAQPPAGQGVALLRAWLKESVTALRVFCWRQPFRLHAEPDHLPVDAAGRCGVLLVHGFVCNRAVWNPWLRVLRHLGVPVLAPSLEPSFGRVEDWIEPLEAAAARLHAATGQPVLVVAHSLGGVAVRAWLQQHPQAAARVRRVVTVGSPHQGAWLARFAWTPNTRQLLSDGAWLQALARQEARWPATAVPFTCFFSDCDNVVFPPAVATLPGADNRLLSGHAHLDLLSAPEILAAVQSWAAAEGAGPRA